MASPFYRADRNLGAIARVAWRRWFLDRKAEFWLSQVRPTWSLRELRAGVADVIAETADAKTFVLEVPRRWPGHHAGQYVPVDVEIDGVRARRCYSISSGASAPGAGRIAITVKRAGRVSGWMHDHLATGAVVRLGAPAGDFTVHGRSAGGKLLLVAAGSGITPIMAIVRELARRGGDGDQIDATVIHCARVDRDAIFGAELARLAAITPGLTVIAHRGRRLDAPTLRAYVPDLAARAAYACGPAGFMELVRSVAGPSLRTEHFAPPIAPPPAPAGSAHVVTLARSGNRVALDGAGTLLEQLERAGERPAHGCRMGICNSCRCTKTSGAALDLVTGAVSTASDHEIRLCISVPCSDLELDL